MPDITIHNDTSETLHVGFRVVTPVTLINSIQPGETRRSNVAGWPQTVEIRKDFLNPETRGIEDARFSGEDSWATFRDVVGGWTAGTGSVILGTVGVVGAVVPAMNAIAAPSLSSAVALGHAASAAGQCTEGNPGVVLSIPGVWPGFYEKHYVIREVDNRVTLWDEDEDRLVG